MHYLNKIKDIESSILFFLSLFIIAFFNEHLTSLKSISIMAALILTLVNIKLNSKKLWPIFCQRYKDNKTSIILFSLFLFAMFISSLFAYTENTKSMYSLYRAIKYPMLFGFILFFISTNKKTIFTLTTAIVISSLFLIFHFLLQDFNLVSFVNGELKIDRFFSTFYEKIFPFSIILFLILRNKLLKLLIFLFPILLGTILLLHTGARGSWLMIFVEFLMILVYIVSKKKSLIIINKNYIITCTIMLIMLIPYFYTHSNIIKSKLNQGTYTSGRDYIIKDRLPIFMQSKEKNLGLGYRGYNYVKFMNDNHAPQRVGKFDSDIKLFKYNHDEPFLLSIFYHYGYIGLITLLLFLSYFIATNIKQIIKNDYNDQILFKVAVFSSIFGIFFTRGLFETMYIKDFIILFVLYLINESSLEESEDENILH